MVSSIEPRDLSTHLNEASLRSERVQFGGTAQPLI